MTVMMPRQSGPNVATRTYTEPVVGTSFVLVFSFGQNFTWWRGMEDGTIGGDVRPAVDGPRPGVSSAWSLGGAPAVPVKVVSAEVLVACFISTFVSGLGGPQGVRPVSFRGVAGMLDAMTAYATVMGIELSSPYVPGGTRPVTE